MTGVLTILITGAGGYIGSHAVEAARAKGHAVRAVVRTANSLPRSLLADKLVEVVPIDLATDSAARQLEQAMTGVNAVIHAAAALSGDDARHERDTIRPLESILAALGRMAGQRPRLVLVSSIAVYNVHSLPPMATLDETCPLERDGAARDAYCRSKLRQESLAVEAASRLGIDVRIIRPGAVFGPGRLMNGHLGPAVGPILLLAGSTGEIPVSFIEHCADALVLAAEKPIEDGDGSVMGGNGRLEFLNVVDDDRPTRKAYVAALRQSGWPRLVVAGVRWPLMAMARALGTFGFDRHLPGLLRIKILEARLKPLKYSNAALRDRLGWQPGYSFKEAMQASLSRPHARSHA